jgi:hypothetical protein
MPVKLDPTANRNHLEQPEQTTSPVQKAACQGRSWAKVAVIALSVIALVAAAVFTAGIFVAAIPVVSGLSLAVKASIASGGLALALLLGILGCRKGCKQEEGKNSLGDLDGENLLRSK